MAKRKQPLRRDEFIQDGKIRRKMSNVDMLLRTWKHKDAVSKARQVIKKIGMPQYYGDGVVGWIKVPKPYTEWQIRDESIPHDFPVPHKDYFYSTMKIDVPPNLMDDLGNVTGSIIIDPLKGIVTARCAELVKNAVTLGFVQDVVKGKVKKDLKSEYGRRIKNNITPFWFRDYLNEIK